MRTIEATIARLNAEYNADVCRAAVLAVEIGRLKAGRPHLRGEWPKRFCGQWIAEKEEELRSIELNIEYFERVGVREIAECELAAAQSAVVAVEGGVA